jgi:hypothetical protein
MFLALLGFVSFHSDKLGAFGPPFDAPYLRFLLVRVVVVQRRPISLPFYDAVAEALATSA